MSAPTTYSANIESLFPGIPEEIGDFDHFARLDRMQEDFLPQSWEELRLAFPLWLRWQTRGSTADGQLGAVYAHQKSSTTSAHPELAPIAITQQMVGYAKQARRDFGALQHLRQELIDFPEPDDSTTTLWQKFGSLPAISGPGQLVRNIDVRRMAERQTELGLLFDPMAGTTSRGRLGSKGIIDPYMPTHTGRPPQSVQDHMQEVLSGYLASDGVEILDAALQNENSRLEFWYANLAEAEHDPRVQHIARPLLIAVGLHAEYRNLPNDDLTTASRM